jgi:hypothetical protein
MLRVVGGMMIKVGLFALLTGCATPSDDACNAAFRFDAYSDLDGDGAGDPATKAGVCALEAGQVTNGDDCDDTDATISPYAAEICDGLDQDCDGEADDNLFGGTWYLDTDGDGYGDPGSPVTGCAQPEGSAADNTDCNDGAADAHPGATEKCDGYDNNCDQLVDDDDPLVDVTTGTFFYMDVDGDGYGDDLLGRQACANPSPTTLTDVGGDCNDADPDQNPASSEVCDHIDNDCDALIDEDDPSLDPATEGLFYEDLDDDGAGNSAVQIQACFIGNNAASVGGDCNDNEPYIQSAGNWIADGDGDGVGAGPVIGAPSCTAPAPGTVPQGPQDDCNDSNAAIFPGNAEVCGDGVDSNCDGNECDEWLEDFEAGPPLPPEMGSSGNALWTVTSAKHHAGSYSAVSGTIKDLQSTNLTLQIDYPNGGTISFWHSGDTEPTYDFLYFSVDGVTVMSKSGNWGWTNTNFNLGAGIHTLKWQYAKDVSNGIGADSVWIDDIEALGGIP